MRIVYLFATFDAGGPQVRMTGLMNAMPPSFEHHIVGMDGRFGAAERLLPNVAAKLVPPPPRGWARGLQTARLVEQLNPDLLVTHNWGALDAAMAQPLGRERRWIHMETGFESDELDRLKLRRSVTRRIVLKRAAYVIVPSHVLLRIASQAWGVPTSKLRWIANGVDLARFSAGRADSLRAALGIPSDAVVVGTVSNLRRVKNPLKLMRAFAACRRGAGAYLVFVGDGPMLRELESTTAREGLVEHVRFVGRQTDVADYHRMFDVFALTSDSEQSPVSVLEAMATGRPVVSTDVGDVRVNVSRANAPFVVPREDAPGFLDALRRLTTDAALRDEVGAANRQRAHASFDERRMAAEFMALFSQFERVPRGST